MCGIFGGINTTFGQKAVAQLHHRGPDQSHVVTEPVGPGLELTLGQTRLNVVDRHDIDLPVRIGDAAILFNGEVYNHIELRAELERLGHRFATKTDTEVVLAAYLEWGHDCLRRFNGMFALAIWDGELLFCARDRMGQKPLFYRSGPERFEVASEIKAFPELGFTSNDVFDLFEFCFDEHTLYRDVYALQPGHFLVYRPDAQTLRIHRWWDIAEQIDGHLDDEDEAIERFVETLRDAIALRLRADVDVTMFMSGGIDSSLIAALAGVKRVFTCQFVEFEGMIDEAVYAGDLATRLGIDLDLVVPTKDEFFTALPALAHHLEIPTGSFSVFPLYQLSAAVKAAGYKVVLSGEGADELFGGYARNEFLFAEQAEPDGEKRRQYASMLGRFRGDPLDQFCRMASRSGLEGAARMRMFLRPHWRDRMTLLQNMCFVEARFFLQPLLQMGDRMTMAHGVEARCPFLDYRMVELAFSMSDRLRNRDGTGKWIVREAARRVLPKGTKLLDRQVKHGLPTPVNLWMQGRHSFDRKYWNAILTAECMKALLGTTQKSAS